MRFDANAEFFRNLNTQWKPTIFSPTMLTQASSDAALWASSTSEFIDFNLGALNQAKAWGNTQRIAFWHQATGELGLPSEMGATLIDAMAPMVLQPPDSVEELAVDLARTTIGVMTNALAAVPVVGPIASMIGAVVNIIIDLRTRPPEEIQQFFAPITNYNPEAEELVMNNTLPVLGSKDWTPLFLPRVGNDLRVERRDAGQCPAWVMFSDERTQHAGFIPGSQQIAGPIQAHVVSKSQGRHGRFCSDFVSHRDVGDFYPGPAQLLTAVSEQVQAPSAALWSVRPDVILDEWREHFRRVMLTAADWWAGGERLPEGLRGLSADRRRAVIQALVAPYFVYESDSGQLLRGVFTANWEPGREVSMRSIVDALVGPWCGAIAQRQDHYLGTTIVAYADPSSPAFENNHLRNRMEHMRRLLLESPARKSVIQDDVIDPGYRKAIFDSTVGSTFASEPVDQSPISIDRSSDTPAEPVPPSGGVPFGDDDTQGVTVADGDPARPGKILAVLLAGAGAGLAIRDLRKRKLGRG